MGELAMVDYYEELSLVKGSDIKSLQEELVRLESLWHKREVNLPEKANKMLGIIMDAQKVFVSEVSRKKYDRELENDKKEPEDPNVSRSKTLEKWTNQARDFYRDGQYDLAKVAVEKALSLSDINGDDDVLFALAADIYMRNGDLNEAMNYINRAIVTAPDTSDYYLSKGLIYDNKALAIFSQNGYGNLYELRAEARKVFQIAYSKAEVDGDNANRARAYGALAYSYYFQDPVDKEKGENFAELAASLGGDSWGNADKVLKEVHAIQEEERRKVLAIEAARKEKIYNAADSMAEYEEIFLLEKAISEFETISDYKDSKQKIEYLQNKIRNINENLIIRRRKRKKILRKGMVLAVVFMIISGIALVARHHKCGENIRWSFARNTGVLTLEGMGEMYDYQYGGSQPWDGFTDDILTVRIKEGITSVGDYSFYYCTNLTDIELCDTVEVIGESAFEGCVSLGEIVLPQSLLIIEDDAFEYCHLKSIYIPSSVKNIGAAFTFTRELELIIADDENPNFITVDGVLFNKDMTVLLRYPPVKEGSEYWVPDSVKEIYDSAFESAENLERVSLPETLNNMGSSAFYDCSNLIDINIPRNIDRIPDFAFSHCGFTSIEIPDNILEIEEYAYTNCVNLKEVNICDGVKSIGHSAFSFCEKLSDITVPKSVDYIGNKAFDYCMEECTINYSGSIDDWHSIDTYDGYLHGYTVKCFDGEL